MGVMDRINKEKLNDVINTIPEGIGLFICYQQGEALFFKITENLRRFIDFYLLADTEDDRLLSLRHRYDWLEFTSSKDLFTCLIEEKFFFKQHQPVFNKRLREWENYAYLSLQWMEVPYIASSGDTLKNQIYIGPFRDSFFIQDVIDTFADVYQLPSCADEVFPCEKMNNQQCAGFCMFGDHSDLRTILIHYVMTPNISVLKDLKKKIAQTENELNFNTSEILQAQHKLISSYYRQLLFLYCTRHINETIEMNGMKVNISQGLIKTIENTNGESLAYFREDLPRNNELLAVNKDELDERWIIFRTLEKDKPNYIKELYQNQFHQIGKIIIEDADRINMEEI
jgi:excinuclease UvrABC nuclease subunit